MQGGYQQYPQQYPQQYGQGFPQSGMPQSGMPQSGMPQSGMPPSNPQIMNYPQGGVPQGGMSMHSSIPSSNVQGMSPQLSQSQGYGQPSQMLDQNAYMQQTPQSGMYPHGQVGQVGQTDMLSQQPQQTQQQFATPEMQISPEMKDGIRWNWNVLPQSRLDATKMILPIGCLYTPLHRMPKPEIPEGKEDGATPQPRPPHYEVPLLNYNPVACRQCRCILNPYCRVDFRTKTWTCPLCLSGNNFPISFSGITETNRPVELYPDFTTVEYELTINGQSQNHPPVFLYVIDTCLPREELEYMKEGIMTSLDLLPENALIGLITFGTTVQLFELGYSEWTNAYVFRGDTTPDLHAVQQQLGLEKTDTQKNANQPMRTTNMTEVRRRFLLPLQEVELTMSSIIEELQPDPWPTPSNTRPKRATGVALSVATSLLESAFMHQGARIMTFIGGPCTSGDGTVVGLDFKEQMRLHNDLARGSAKYFKSASKFYQSLTQRLVKNGHCVDIWAANLDQCGILEMKSCCENTGGTMILTDTFNNPVFSNSLTKFFERVGDDQLDMAFNATLEVQTSADVRICGALGPVTSMNTKHRCVSETEIGYGKTNSWKMNALTQNTTVAIYFDIPAQIANSGNSPARFFQFVTTYQHANGSRRLRVTTTGVRYTSTDGNFQEISQGFDQGCAAVLMARLAVFKAESEYLFDVLRWLDRSLIQLASKFGSYRKGMPESLELPPHFQSFPQFMFHLRRSHFLRVFNSSPDETSYYRLHLNRVGTHDGLTMIQPSLCMITMQNPDVLQPVPLDSDSVRKDVALLLDTYFLILVHFGERVAYWRNQEYHMDPKYSNLKTLLETPRNAAKELLKERFPYPRYYVCDEGTSQARHLLARINPSTTHHNTYQKVESALVYSDDANYATFQKHLSKIVSEESM